MKILGVLLIIVLAHHVIAQDNSALQAAQGALDNFKKAVNRENFKALNFSSYDESQNMSVGNEVKSFNIRLDDLRNYKEGSPTDQLLKLPERKIFILISAQAPIGSVELEPGGKKWILKSIGKQSVIKSFAEYAGQATEKQMVLIRVMALNRNFAGRLDQGRWIVVLLGGSPLGDMKPNQELDLQRVLPLLQVEANQYNGLPW